MMTRKLSAQFRNLVTGKAHTKITACFGITRFWILPGLLLVMLFAWGCDNLTEIPTSGSTEIESDTLALAAPPMPPLPDPPLNPKDLPDREPAEPGNWENQNDQPSITLTLEPAEIYEGDRVTLRWEVRNRLNGSALIDRAWGYPVYIRSSFVVAPPIPHPAPNPGSYTFTAGSSTRHGTFTLRTGSVLFPIQKTVDYTAILKPHISVIIAGLNQTVAPHDSVTLHGSNFGDRRQNDQVNLVLNGQTLVMPVESWTDDTIVVRVPDDAEVGRGTVRVSKGPSRLRLEGINADLNAYRELPFAQDLPSSNDGNQVRVVRDTGTLVSNSMPLKVVGRTIWDDGRVQAVALLLDLASTQIHLDAGQNESYVNFSDPMIALGASNETFTVPPFSTDVSVTTLFGSILMTVIYQVNNIDSNDVSISISDGQVILSLSFEGNGSEIIGRAESLFGSIDDLIPDVQLDNAQITVRLTPGSSSGKFVFWSATATFDADIRIGNDLAEAIIPENVLRRAAGQIRSEINERVNDAVNTSEFREAFGDAFMDMLQELDGVSRVLEVTAFGDHITVIYE